MRFDSLNEWLSWQETFHPKKVDLGLKRVKDVFDRLYPEYEAQKPFTITVAGTNGKGSTVSMLEQILVLAGYKVGTYTSPHILRYNERIRLNGMPMGDGPICEAFHRIDLSRKDVSLSFFEFGTLAALDLFAREKVDVQILEVGLGGRLDAVNIIDTDMALISAIDIDHSDLLGDTRELIGYEKAGIFRADGLALIGDPEPPHSVLNHAEQLGIEIKCFRRDYDFHREDDRWSWAMGDDELDNLPFPNLPGDQQFANASLVIAALRSVKERLPINVTAIAEGLRTVKLAGRYQLIKDQNQPVVMLDVGHNPQAAKHLAAFLKKNYSNQKIHALFNIMHDKDVSSVLELMRDVVTHWHLVPLQVTRASNMNQLTEFFEAVNIKAYSASYPCTESAFQAAHEVVAKDDLILVFGSFYLVSAYLGWKP